MKLRRRTLYFWFGIDVPRGFEIDDKKAKEFRALVRDITGVDNIRIVKDSISAWARERGEKPSVIRIDGNTEFNLDEKTVDREELEGLVFAATEKLGLAEAALPVKLPYMNLVQFEWKENVVYRFPQNEEEAS